MAEARRPPGAGHGTFELIDRARFFGELKVEKSTDILDVGCGRGDYSIALAEATGPSGLVYALDAWEEGPALVAERASRAGLVNVRTLVADVNKGIPLPDRSVDLCLMATVLHDLLRESTGKVALSEVARVLRGRGRLAIVEFKKIGDGPPGPPLRIRMSEEEVEAVIAPFGFRKETVSELGDHHYLLIASRGSAL